MNQHVMLTSLCHFVFVQGVTGHDRGFSFCKSTAGLVSHKSVGKLIFSFKLCQRLRYQVIADWVWPAVITNIKEPLGKIIEYKCCFIFNFLSRVNLDLI